MNFFVLLNIKEDTLKKKYISSIVPNILFCIQQQKESHTGLEQQQHFHFWVNYSSKAA